MLLIGFPLIFVLWKKGKCINSQYIKYAVAYCWPFVPHLLALKALNASDRIMIKNMIGSEANATYTIANNCVSIAVLLFTSLNTAVSPWVFDRLHSKKTEELRKLTLPYVAIFAAFVYLIQLIAPEVLWIIGGEKYLEAKACFLPLFTSVIVQFCYALYVNIEQYSKKTWAITLGTTIAAIVNIVLNFLLIPRYGYVAAAYTTLVGYIVLFLVHYSFVRIIGYKNIYNDKVVFAAIIFSLMFQLVILVLYQHDVARYIVAGIYILIGACLVFWKRKEIIKILKEMKKNRHA